MTDSRLPRVHHQLRGTMVELVGLKRFDEAYIVHDFREVRKAIRNPGSRVAVLLERILWAEHVRSALDECEVFPF